LIAKVAKKVWVVTLGPRGASTRRGTKIAEIGPVHVVTAPEYLLRLNYGSGPARARTRVHSHPGSESFYVISGRLGQRTPQGVINVDAGYGMNGHDAYTSAEIFNAGDSELEALVMFVLVASKPFSAPATLDSGN